MLRLLLPTLLCCATALQLSARPATHLAALRPQAAAHVSACAVQEVEREKFTCSFEIPAKGITEYGTCNMEFKPILVESELVVVKYDLPFGLSAEPRGRVVAVTKDGSGGEKV